jgi:hypothetical protein
MNSFLKKTNLLRNELKMNKNNFLKTLELFYRVLCNVEDLSESDVSGSLDSFSDDLNLDSVVLDRVFLFTFHLLTCLKHSAESTDLKHNQLSNDETRLFNQLCDDRSHVLLSILGAKDLSYQILYDKFSEIFRNKLHQPLQTAASLVELNASGETEYMQTVSGLPANECLEPSSNEMQRIQETSLPTHPPDQNSSFFENIVPRGCLLLSSTHYPDKLKPANIQYVAAFNLTFMTRSDMPHKFKPLFLCRASNGAFCFRCDETCEGTAMIEITISGANLAIMALNDYEVTICRGKDDIWFQKQQHGRKTIVNNDTFAVPNMSDDFHRNVHFQYFSEIPQHVEAIVGKQLAYSTNSLHSNRKQVPLNWMQLPKIRQHVYNNGLFQVRPESDLVICNDTKSTKFTIGGWIGAISVHARDKSVEQRITLRQKLVLYLKDYTTLIEAKSGADVRILESCADTRFGVHTGVLISVGLFECVQRAANIVNELVRNGGDFILKLKDCPSRTIPTAEVDYYITG